MSKFLIPIIPSRQNFYGFKDEIDYEAVCVFSALGFFLGTDSFWKGRKTMPVASECEFDENENLISSKSYFKWHYTPRRISLENAVDEFADLFESIVEEQVKNKKTILPLSGGLDSRTQAAALKNIGSNVASYSYSFCGGHDETHYSKKIAEVQNFSFSKWKIETGYLWDVIDKLAQINECYSEFTHPRQMAFFEKYADLGEVFSLGHWGDVMFDDMGISEDLADEEQLKILLKKVLKKSGLELGSVLWKAWGLRGNFKDYLYERIKSLFSGIDIANSINARIRAFKSMFWATRWTSVNLSVFESVKPITLPYFDNRMCEFICTIPEEHLAGRKIQIEYLKRNAPKLAGITWQDHRPFNLHNYQWDKSPWNLPYRFYSKVKRSILPKPFIQRNWELQFLGEKNDEQLRARLFDNKKLSEWIPENIIHDFYENFTRKDAVYYSHGISILLTLSLFSTHFLET